MKIIKQAGFAVLLSTSIGAEAAVYDVLGGSFTINAGGFPVGTISMTGTGQLTEGVFDGSASALASNSSATNAGLSAELFLGYPMYFYFAPDGVYDVAGAPHPAPSIDLVGMTADMTSMFGNWNSAPGNLQEFNVGGIATVTQLNATDYALDWTAPLSATFPTLGDTIVMHMEVRAVPLPASVWLFGSGFLGLLGLTRKRLQ